MAPSLLCCIILQMFLLSNAQHYLTVHPVDPVVSIGASIQLNCSINCPLGIVEWKGLDNENNEQYIAPGYSVQTLENMSISMGGTKYCEATCPANRRSYRQSVELHVYALTKTLLLRNHMINGVHYLKCSMERVYPPPEISCYRGSKMLGEATDINEVPDGDLYNVTWSWVIPEEDWLSEISYRCEAKVLVNDQVLTREGTLKISSKEETTTTVPASPTSQITSALPCNQEDTTIGSQQSTFPGKYTRNPNINSVTTHSTPPATAKGPTKPINIAQHYLTVHPVDPVVSIGVSIQLNCSINCPLGIVEWKGLDNENNEQYIAPGYSVQTLENMSISMGGTKYCEATCPADRRSYRQSVELHVYALPKTLLLRNHMINGVHYLKCSMEHVYPPPEISCYRGSEMLGEATDINEIPDGDLYNVTWSWVIPEMDWLPEISYRCEAKVLVNDQVLTRDGTLKISSKAETTTAFPASPNFQITSFLSQKQETPYVTTTIITPQNTQTMQKDRTIESQQSTLPGKYTKNATINTVTTQSTPPSTAEGPTEPIDGFHLMWTVVPATCLVGSFLLSLQIYRQLTKKGFFQPNHTEMTTVKKDAKSQRSLQTVFCYDVRTKKEFSMC